MALYENVFIARQDITAQQVTELTDSFAGIITAQGGKITKTENWGLRSLAYKIQKNKKGHYVLFNIDAPPAAVIELERNMRINEDVLRYMTVKVDALEEGPSAVLRKEREYEGRDDFGGRPQRGFGGGGGFGGDRPKRSRSDNEGDN